MLRNSLLGLQQAWHTLVGGCSWQLFSPDELRNNFTDKISPTLTRWLCRDAICSLILGSPPGKVYSKLRSTCARLNDN